MRTTAKYLLWGSLAIPATTLQLPVIRARGPLDERPLNGVQQPLMNRGFNSFYVTNVTIAGVEVPLAIDTGSSDLWVSETAGIFDGFSTDIKVNVSYGSGKVFGVVAYAPVSIGQYSLESQVFINTTEIKGTASMLDYGAKGLLGLGFNMPAIGINYALTATLGPDRILETNPVAAILSLNPSLPRFFTALFGRAVDLPTGPHGGNGVFTLGEYAAGMETIASAPRLKRFVPRGHDFESWPRWTTAVEGVRVHGRDVALHSAFADLPQADKNALAIFDTGTTLSAVPSYVAEAIYGVVDGAFLVEDLRPGKRDWVVPCDAVVNVAFIFGGQEFHVHPLDLSRPRIIGVDGEDSHGIVCTGVYEAMDVLPEWGVDMLLGDSFLLNAYSSYNFGDANEGPFMQLLPLTNPDEAHAEFLEQRRQELTRLPPELSRAEISNLFTVSTDKPTSKKPSPGEPVVLPDPIPSPVVEDVGGAPEVPLPVLPADFSAVFDGADAPFSFLPEGGRSALLIVGIVAFSLTAVVMFRRQRRSPRVDAEELPTYAQDKGKRED